MIFVGAWMGESYLPWEERSCVYLKLQCGQEEWSWMFDNSLHHELRMCVMPIQNVKNSICYCLAYMVHSRQTADLRSTPILSRPIYLNLYIAQTTTTN